MGFLEDIGRVLNSPAPDLGGDAIRWAGSNIVNPFIDDLFGSGREERLARRDRVMDRWSDRSRLGKPLTPEEEADQSQMMMDMFDVGPGLGIVKPIKNEAAAVVGKAAQPLLKSVERGAGEAIADVATKKAPEWLEGFKNLFEFRKAHPDRVVFHGTTTTYGKGDPTKVSKGGLVGPGHYTSDSPEVVGTYAFGSTNPDADLNEYIRKITSEQNSANKYRSEAADIRAEYGPEDLVDAKEALDQLDREAAAHEAEIARLQQEMGEKASYYNLEPQIRPAILPPTDFTPNAADAANFHLFDFTKEAPTEDLAKLDQVIAEMRGQPSLYPMAEWGVGGNNALLHEELTNILNGQNRANEALAKAGYDGIRHIGGRTIGSFDQYGRPLEHDVTVVFPESLMKIRNALSGAPGGQANVGYAAGLGGAAGLLGLLQYFFGQGQGQQPQQGAW